MKNKMPRNYKPVIKVIWEKTDKKMSPSSLKKANILGKNGLGKKQN